MTSQKELWIDLQILVECSATHTDGSVKFYYNKPTTPELTLVSLRRTLRELGYQITEVHDEFDKEFELTRRVITTNIPEDVYARGTRLYNEWAEKTFSETVE